MVDETTLTRPCVVLGGEVDDSAPKLIETLEHLKVLENEI